MTHRLHRHALAAALMVPWIGPTPTTMAMADPSATCRSVGLDPPRTWQFTRSGATWQVAHWRGTASANAVRLTLPPTALVRLSADAVDIKARTSNGGIDVALSGAPATARLDIYVSYELEVNVDSSLTPAIDDLNTDGPVGVRCTVDGI